MQNKEIVVKKNVPITVTYSDFSSLQNFQMLFQPRQSLIQRNYLQMVVSWVSEQTTETNDISKMGK